jgi:hypothetical protein
MPLPSPMTKVTDRRPAEQAFASFLLTGQERIFSLAAIGIRAQNKKRGYAPCRRKK